MIRILYDTTTRTINHVMMAEGITRPASHIKIFEGGFSKIINQFMDEGIDFEPVMTFLRSVPNLDFNPDDLLLVVQHKRECIELVNEFLSENKRMDVPFEVDLQLMEQFAPIKYALEIGAANRALAMWLEIEPDGVIITSERHQKYVDKLVDILLRYPA